MSGAFPDSEPSPNASIAPGLSVAEARRMYARMLGSWVMDLTHLRVSGLDRPSYRRTNGDLPAPAWQAPLSSTWSRSRHAA